MLHRYSLLVVLEERINSTDHNCIISVFILIQFTKEINVGITGVKTIKMYFIGKINFASCKFDNKNFTSILRPELNS